MTRFGDWGHRTFSRWFDALEWVSDRVGNVAMTVLTPITIIATIALWLICIIGANTIDWLTAK